MSTTDPMAPDGPSETLAQAEVQGHIGAAVHWPEVRDFLLEHPELLTGDRELLEQLGLVATAPNKVVDFGRAALTRLEEKAKRETVTRKNIEQLARSTDGTLCAVGWSLTEGTGLRQPLLLER